MTAVPPLPRWHRLSDRLNPILVREVQQALSSKAFLGTLFLALISVLVLAAVIATMTLGGDDTVGRGAFAACLGTLAPILVFILPLQAFFSMMQEVRAGSAEMLLLSHLTPAQIVRGKVQAAAVLFVLYLAIFAPLIALTYLLRGVDVGMIAFALLLALIVALAASSLGIAAGALTRARVLTPLWIAMVTVVLGIATGMAIAGGVGLVMEFAHFSRRAEFWQVLGSIALGLAAALWLFALVAKTQLTHPNENRSTPFRVFAVVSVLVIAGWIVLVADRRDLAEALPVFALVALTIYAGVGLFLTCEDDELSPRVRTQVPRHGALFAAPFLPGGALGFGFTLLWLALVLALGLWLPYLLVGGGRPWAVRSAIMIAEYLVIYLGYAAWLRRRLPRGPHGSWLARGLVVMTLGLACLGPMLIEVFLARRGVRWSPLHILNPFFTIDRFDLSGGVPVIWGLFVASILAVMLNIRALAVRMRDVRRASLDHRASRARAA